MKAVVTLGLMAGTGDIFSLQRRAEFFKIGIRRQKMGIFNEMFECDNCLCRNADCDEEIYCNLGYDVKLCLTPENKVRTCSSECKLGYIKYAEGEFRPIKIMARIQKTNGLPFVQEYEGKCLRLLGLQHELKKQVMPIGSMHPLWDVLFDIQLFLEGKPTILQKTVDEWIAYTEELLHQNKKTCPI